MLFITESSHRLRILEILGIDPKAANKASVQTALLHLDSKDLEAEAAKRGACAFAFRSEAEWDQKSQGIAVKQEQPVTIIKIEEATQPRPIQSGAVQGGLPLTGLRVLEMTRVLAGPVAGRTLAGINQFTAPADTTIRIDLNFQPRELIHCGSHRPTFHRSQNWIWTPHEANEPRN